MSDIRINVHYPKECARRRPPGRPGRGRRKKLLNQEASEVDQRGMKPSRQAPPTQHQAARFTHRGSSAANASHHGHQPMSKAHGPPPSTAAVDTARLKGPVNRRPMSGGHRPASGGCKAMPSLTSPGLHTKYVAIDCEMVGTGPKGSISQLARCSIVSYEGDVLYDKFINPSMPVTDYRTRWSGIRRSDLVNATPYCEARKEILRLLMGKVVIGHAIHNDFKVLGYGHPRALTRDTSRIPLLNAKAGFGVNECASLKRLTKAIFNRDIQTGSCGHSSVEDARATMELYKVVEEELERSLDSR